MSCYNDGMKIILVAAGAKGRNVVFVDNALNVYPLEEAVQLARARKLENMHAVEKGSGVYLRTSRNVPKKAQLEQLAISQRQLFNFANDTGSGLYHLALKHYLQLQERALRRRENLPYIAIGRVASITKRKAREKLKAHEGFVFEAAKKFDIDPYLLGAIIIDELARFDTLESITDPLLAYYIGVDASAGIAQVTMETARGLIQDGYYNPNPTDPKLSPNKVRVASRKDLYEYVKQPKHSVFFAAAHMRALIDHWKRFVDLYRRPDIIATLYSIGRGKDPHSKPQPSERGLRIAGEFYRLARKWLR